MFVLPFVAGGMAGLAPETWPTAARWAIALPAALAPAGLLLGLRAMLRKRRARRMAAEQGDMRVEDRGDHLAVYSAGRSRFVAPETIAQVIADGGHVLLWHDGGPTILPLRAFADAADMQAYAEVLRERILGAGA